MKTKTRKMLFGMMLMSGTLSAFAQQLAFPEAQGWGRYATGGRSGSVYHVTNLNDSGKGSLRDAVSQPNRIVVFDVAGVINITDRIVFAKNLYVAGQTAPGEGVTVYGNGVSFSGADNIIIRYMRFRMGHKGSAGKDAAGIANGANMIFDHCSFSWGLDETFSINPDNKGTKPQLITISNSIMGQGLLTHSAGGLMQSDSITLYRNLYCDNATRNNKIKGTNQYVNNIVYNWKNAAYIMGGDSEGDSYCNIESNLFINGPAVGGAAFTGGNSNFHFYGDDNWQDQDRDGVFNPKEVTDYSASDRQSKPYNYPKLEKWAGNTLLDNLLPTVGASLPYRDYSDYYMIDEVNSLGKSGSLISNEENLIYGAPNTWKVWAGNKRIDTDGDGMPDEWEKKNGTDPNKDDAMVKASNGYTNIENYINSITVDDRDYHLRAPMCVEFVSATTTTIKLKWRDYTYAEDGFAIEVKKKDGGEWTEVGRTEANATSFTISNLESGVTYLVRLRAFAATDKVSDYTEEFTMSTRPVEVGIVDIDSYQPDLTWNTGATSWDTSSKSWNGGQDTFADGKKVLFTPTGDESITLNEVVSPEVVVVNGDGNLTVNGDGAIAGDGSVNKSGEGMFALNTANTYKGATVLHEGVLEMNTLKNGGEPSSIGASVNFAQNWIFDGGVYRYTGGSTATDRAAKITRETEFNIASNATVTMNGVFEGSSDLALNGVGQLTVGTNKFFGYTGATILRGGRLYLSTTDIAKTGIGSSSKLVMAGGELKTAGETNGYETYSFPIELEEGTTSQFTPFRNCYLKNKLSGSGTLQLNIPYLREYVDFDISAFSGRIIANSVSSEKEGGLFLLQKGKENLSSIVVEAKGNVRITAWDTNADCQLGGLSGASTSYLSGSSKSTANFTCSWTVGSANTDETFNGKINNWAAGGSKYKGKVSIAKVGTGDWRLTGANDYSGTTSVKSGRLIVNGTNSGTGTVSVSKDATLKGKGTIAGRVTIMNGGILAAGDTLINAETLKLTGGCALLAGSNVEIPLYSVDGKTKSNKIKVSGNFAINDAVLNLDLTEAPSFEDDKVFQIFDLTDATVSGTGFTTIEPARPSETQVWDTSMLLTKGYIYVRKDTSSNINKIKAQTVEGVSYDLNGRKIETPSKGLYIQNGKKYVKK